MATDAERRAAVIATKKALDAKRGTRSAADKKAQIASAKTTAGILFFALPGGAIIRVASGARRALQAVRAMRGAKPIAKPTATQISKAKPPTQAQLTAPKPQAALPKPKSGNTTPLASKPQGNVISGTAREVKPGTSVVPSGGRAVKKPDTGVQRIIRVKDKKPNNDMKYAQRNDKKLKGPKSGKRGSAIGPTAAAALIAGMTATMDGDKKPSAAGKGYSGPLPKSKPSKPTKRVDLGTVKAHKVTPQKDAPPKSSGPSTSGSNKKAAPAKVISAGPNTGFGPKGNIFPGSAAERAGYMKMYGGTGSAAAKAAAAGKQGDMKAGRAAVDAAKKKRLSKKKD